MTLNLVQCFDQTGALVLINVVGGFSPKHWSWNMILTRRTGRDPSLSQTAMFFGLEPVSNTRRKKKGLGPGVTDSRSNSTERRMYPRWCRPMKWPFWNKATMTRSCFVLLHTYLFRSEYDRARCCNSSSSSKTQRLKQNCSLEPSCVRNTSDETSERITSRVGIFESKSRGASIRLLSVGCPTMTERPDQSQRRQQ